MTCNQNVKTLTLHTLGVIFGIITSSISTISLIIMDHGYATSKYRINKARSLVKALNSVKDEKSEPVEFWGRISDGNLPSDDDPKVQQFATVILIVYTAVLILLIIYILSRSVQ